MVVRWSGRAGSQAQAQAHAHSGRARRYADASIPTNASRIPKFLQDFDKTAARRKHYSATTGTRNFIPLPRRPRSPSSPVSDDSAHPDIPPYDKALQWALVPYVPPTEVDPPLTVPPSQRPAAPYKQNPTIVRTDCAGLPLPHSSGRYLPPQKRGASPGFGRRADTQIGRAHV